MRKIIASIFVLFVVAIVNGQNTIHLSRKVISTASLSGTNSGGIYLTACVGQPEYKQESSEHFHLHQGFEQADRQWCIGDYNQNGFIETGDVLLMLPLFGCTEFCDDINQDGIFNILDLLIFVSLMGNSCNIQ